MNWQQDSFAPLGLAALEVKVLNSMLKLKSISEISRDCKVPRTTVAYKIESLIKRKLVIKTVVGRRRQFMALNQSQAISALQGMVDAASMGEKKRSGVKVKTSPKDEFIIHVGATEIGSAYSRIALMNKNERIRAIQHHRSFNMLQQKMSPQQLLEFNKAVIDNHLIIDGMLNESAYKSYWQEIKHDPKKYKEVVASLGGRMADYNVFPDEFFDYDAEIWIFKTTTLIISWQEEVAIEIINGDMTGFLKDMFEFVKKGGQKIDHNALMRKLLGEKK